MRNAREPKLKWKKDALFRLSVVETTETTAAASAGML
jgi:hypothetical protein